MNDHAKKDYMVRKITKRERIATFCAYIKTLPPCAFVRRYRGWRRANFSRRVSFWLAFNKI